MALQVWLPLNGNINNQGLSNLKFSNSNTSNTVINTSGKIGSCYLNVRFSGGGLVSNTTINLGQNVSMFCWVKVTQFNSSDNLSGIISNHHYETPSGIGLTLRYASSTTGHAGRCILGHIQANTKKFRIWIGGTAVENSQDFNLNQWYHLVATRSGSTLTLYIDGVLKGTATKADALPSVLPIIGSTNYNNTYALSSGTKISDVRIYATALSADDVLKLYKLGNV